LCLTWRENVLSRRISSKKSGLEKPDFGLSTEGTSIFFTLLRQSAGVMEWWSNGVMKGSIQIEIGALAFSNTPILQYSEIARNLYRHSH
jgi:hypothetical protein